MPVTLLLVDDHAIVRQGLKMLLDTYPELHVVGEASDGIQAIDLVKSFAPDVTVLDIMMPGLNGLEVTRQINRLTKVIILSMYKDEAYVAEALQNGASGFVLKDSTSTDLVLAIHTVMQGGIFLCKPFSEDRIKAYLKKIRPFRDPKLALLTARELQVLQVTAEGFTSIEAAGKLHISSRTVEIHLAHIYQKLDLHSRADLTRFAIQHNLISS